MQGLWSPQAAATFETACRAAAPPGEALLAHASNEQRSLAESPPIHPDRYRRRHDARRARALARLLGQTRAYCAQSRGVSG
jgi:cell division septum initiation protein DivIVA